MFRRSLDRKQKPAKPNPLRNRLRLGAICFIALYGVIGGRLTMLAVGDQAGISSAFAIDKSTTASRPDILDREGRVLATDVTSHSLFAEAHRITFVDETVDRITSVLPALNRQKLRADLSKDRRFVWLKREISPAQRRELQALGIPGIGFRTETRRVYPNGRMAAHILGAVNVDNRGIAGIEKHLDDRGLAELHGLGFGLDRDLSPVSLSLDLRVQHALTDELHYAMEKYSAIAAAGSIMDIHTGEVIAMASLPDFDPNDPASALDENAINRLLTGVFEMGSTFKAINTAMALETDRITLNSTYDARAPIRIGGHSIDDSHPKRKVMTVAEVFKYSSNIGSAKMALDVGIEGQQEFLRRMGLLNRLRTEMPESSAPLVPNPWKRVSAMTISFGHGISVAPMSMAAATMPLFNGGYAVPVTFLQRDLEEARAASHRVISEKTSQDMIYLMDLNSKEGTGRKANKYGYRVGGKTGTSQKVINGRYSDDKLRNSFLAVFPTEAPRYVVLVILDEPQGIKETHGFMNAGWNAAPTTGEIVGRVAPMLGLRPEKDPVEPRSMAELVARSAQSLQ